MEYYCIGKNDTTAIGIAYDMKHKYHWKVDLHTRSVSLKKGLASINVLHEIKEFARLQERIPEQETNQRMEHASELLALHDMMKQNYKIK